MNIKEFEIVRNKPYDVTLAFELFEGSDFDKKSHKVIVANDDLFAESKMNNEVFRYNITNKMSLRKYLSMRMDQETITHIVRRLMDVEKFFSDRGIDKKYIMYDSDLVLVDKDSEEITFITVPASDHGLTVKPFRAFVKEVVANAVYDEEENLDYVGRILTFINSHREIDLDEMRALLERIEASTEDSALDSAASDIPFDFDSAHAGTGSTVAGHVAAASVIAGSAAAMAEPMVQGSVSASESAGESVAESSASEDAYDGETEATAGAASSVDQGFEQAASSVDQGFESAASSVDQSFESAVAESENAGEVAADSVESEITSASVAAQDQGAEPVTAAPEGVAKAGREAAYESPAEKTAPESTAGPAVETSETAMPDAARKSRIPLPRDIRPSYVRKSAPAEDAPVQQQPVNRQHSISQQQPVNRQQAVPQQQAVNRQQAVPQQQPVNRQQTVPQQQAVPQQRPVQDIPLAKKYPYLVRTKNREIVTIDKDEFKIGKIQGMADYLLSDNRAVSRMHAIIHNVDGAYYICDNYSTNATYLNGERLEPGRNYLLLNGVRVSLANEEFTFLQPK